MTLSEIYIALADAALNGNDFSTVTAEVKRLNRLYRQGKPEILDPEYDRLIDTIRAVNPENEIFQSGVIETIEVDSDRKEKLKYPMFSLDKESSIEEIKKWLLNKGLPLSTVLVCTAKYDGISVLKNEKTALVWSRGDGIEGETMHEHYKKLNTKNSDIEIYTIGEMIIPKPVFATHTFYRDNGEAFKNARNMIAGLKNSDTISDDLKYANHVRYGFASEDFTKNKTEQLDFISKELNPVPYKVFRADQLKVEELDELFIEWSKEYDIDGLVFDINDKDIRKNLGRERNNNPSYARAYKNPEWSTKNIAKEKSIEWNLSKTKALKPVVLIEPFDVDGVTISRVTGYNAKFILDNQIGDGAELEIIRSGGVIPKIIGVSKVGKLALPTRCPSCDTELKWNENNVDLVCLNKDCGEINFQKVAFFFVRFNIVGFAEKTIKKVYDAGYDTVGKILSMNFIDIQKIEGMGNLSATKLLKEFDEKIKQAPFEVIGHASGCFENIGSRKLKMISDGIKDITDYTGNDFNFFKSCFFMLDFDGLNSMLKFDGVRKEIIQKLNSINGMSNKTSDNFLTGLLCFGEFMKDLNITISDELKVKKVTPKNNNNNMKTVDLKGREFVFTGFRDAELKSFIETCGGVVKDSITKNTTDLLTKNPDTTSAKAVKAKGIGANVMQVDDFKLSL
jgi:NAD-dependent DNA ligase